MPNALFGQCPMPNAQSYLIFLRKAIYHIIGCDPLTRLQTTGHSSSNMLTKDNCERKEEKANRWLVRYVLL
jgi:hypothetical protein